MGDAIPWDAEIYPLLFATAGVLVAVAAPRLAVGWLMLFVGACFAVNAVALQLLAAGTPSGAAGLAWWSERGSAVLVPATLLLVLLLPDGRLPSRGWRPVVRVVVGVQLAAVAVGSVVAGPIEVDSPAVSEVDNPLGVLPRGLADGVDAAIGILLVLPFLLGVVAVAQRLRHPAGDERPRVVVVLLGALVFALCLTVPDLVWPQASMWFHIAGVAALTGTITVATVRGQLAPVHVPVVASAPAAVDAPAVTVPAVAPPAVDESASALLSPREREVMEHLSRGLTNSEIAAELVISPITVRNHVSSILTKLDAANRTQAVARYLGQA